MSRRRRILELAGVVHRNHSDAFRILKEEEGDDDADLFGDTADDSDTSDDNADDADAGGGLLAQGLDGKKRCVAYSAAPQNAAGCPLGK